jgi:hypothetical protein
VTLLHERDALEQQIHALCDAGDHRRAAMLPLEGFGREKLRKMAVEQGLVPSKHGD